MAKKGGGSRLKTDARKEIIRENYRMLKEAGFSSKEAGRYRNASRENVLAAIAAKQIPEPKPEYRRAKPWVKTREKDFKTSTSVTHEIRSLHDGNFKRVYEKMVPYYKEGFRNFHIRIHVVLNDGTAAYWQTPMMNFKDIEGGQDISDIVANMVDEMLAKYTENDDIKVKKVTVEIIQWKAKPMAKAG